MQLLISDANILIDMEAASLMRTLFELPFDFGIPDLLYYEEIEEGTPDLDALGLQLMEVHGEFVKYAASLPKRYNTSFPSNNGAKPDHNDYLALALAKQENCTLLTGDANLRLVAKGEGVMLMGTIGLLCSMVENSLLTVDDALAALDRMKNSKRRLPWELAKQLLNELR